MKKHTLKWLASGAALGSLAFAGTNMLYGRWRISLPERGIFARSDLESEFKDKPLPKDVLDKFEAAVNAHLHDDWTTARKLYFELAIEKNGRLLALADLSAAVAYNLYLLFRVEGPPEVAAQYKAQYDYLQYHAQAH